MRGLHFFAELSTKVLSLSRISLGLLYFSCFPVQTAVRKISFSGKKHLHSPIKYHPLASVTIDCGCNCSKTEPLHVVRWVRQILYLYRKSTGNNEQEKQFGLKCFGAVVYLLSSASSNPYCPHLLPLGQSRDNAVWRAAMYAGDVQVLTLVSVWTALHVLRASRCWAEIIWERGMQKERDVFWWVAKEVAQDAFMETCKGHHPVSPAVIIFSMGTGAGG